MKNLLKKADRTLLEMYTGLLVTGAACQVAGAFITKEQGRYAASLWLGILLAMAGCAHMGKTLDRALASGDGARRIITTGYAVRYLLAAVILGAVAATEILNPIAVFVGCMSLKIAAYLQPLTHSFYNRLFHETDPVPQAMPDEEA